MRLEVIATGSKANCYMLTSHSGDAVMLDCGLRLRALLKQWQWHPFNACLITHEHQDHCAGVKDLLKRGVTVMGTEGTAKALGIERELGYEKLEIGKVRKTGRMTILPFATQHDAEEPCGYLIRDELGATALYATDTYYLRNTFPFVDYWIIECNYIESNLVEQMHDMPVMLAERLSRSHMSLERLLEALKANDLSRTKKIVLVHLSDSRSNEQEMIRQIQAETGIETIAAMNGMTIDLD